MKAIQTKQSATQQARQPATSQQPTSCDCFLPPLSIPKKHCKTLPAQKCDVCFKVFFPAVMIFTVTHTPSGLLQSSRCLGITPTTHPTRVLIPASNTQLSKPLGRLATRHAIKMTWPCGYHDLGTPLSLNEPRKVYPKSTQSRARQCVQKRSQKQPASAKELSKFCLPTRNTIKRRADLNTPSARSAQDDFWTSFAQTL